MRLWVLLERLRDRLLQLAAQRKTRAGRVFITSLIGLLAVTRPVSADSHDEPGTAAIDWIFQNMADVAYQLAGVLAKGVVLFIGVMTNVMLYKDFSTNRVVTAGWSIVRDTVNMFFVVVLIIIAFGTIFGHSKFQWQQQVPKLMIFALVINFSKTLCGLMIDFGQVIMLTFANAIREIVAGNFIQLLGLGEIYQVSTSSTPISESKGFAAFDYFAAGLMSVVLMIWVFATVVILTVILIYRVIMLWVLIVVSPLAWFMGGAGGQGGIVSSNAYAQWWDRFKCLVAVGPVLTFFLWLTLAVAGAGNVAASTGFNPSDENSANFIGKIFELDRFMSFLIGMAMLYAGFDAAQQFCSSMSGSFLGSTLKKGQGVGGAMAGVGIKATAAGARKVGGGLRAAPKYLPGGAQLSEALTNLPFNRENLYRGVANVAGDGMIGRAASLGASKAAAAKASKRRQAYDKAGETFKGTTREDKAAYARRFMQKGGASTAEGQRELVHLLKEAMGDKDLAKEMKKDGTLGKLHDKYGGIVQRDFGGDDDTRKKMDAFNRDNLDLLTGPKHAKDREKAIGSIRSWDDVKGMSAESMNQSDVRERLEKTETNFRGENGKALSAAEALAAGYGGSEKAAAFQQRTDFSAVPASAVAQQVAGGNQEAAADAFSRALEAGDMSKATEIIEAMAGTHANTDAPEAGAERFNLSVGMDGIEGKLKAALSSAEMGGASEAQVGQLKSVLEVFNAQRKSAEASTAFAGSYGTVPDIAAQSEAQEDFSGAAFAEGAFGGASNERLADAAEQIAEQVRGLEKAVADVKLNAGGSASSGAEELLSTRIDFLTQQIKNDVEARIKSKVDASKGLSVRLDTEQDLGKRQELQAQKTQVDVEINNEITAAMDGSEDLKKLRTQMDGMKKALDEARAASDKVAELKAIRSGGDAAGRAAT